MVHNKTFEILKFFIEDYNNGIYGRSLIKKVSLSQKNIALTLNNLEKEGILKSNKQGNIKYFNLNLNSPKIKDIITSVEINKKINFLEKHKKIAEIFKEDNRIVGIFGSYAKGIERKDSDIDIFIIGEKQREDYDRKGKLFDINVSIKYFSEKEFKDLLVQKNNLCKEIIKNHIVIFNIEKFTDIGWRFYYGLN